MSSKQNPLVRITALTRNDLDYPELEIEFHHLIELAKVVTGLPVGLINFIDAHHLWPISQSGSNLQVMPLQNTPCQYTIIKQEYFEVKDLSSHEVLKEMDYVKGPPHYKYYFGVPLTTLDGINMGSLCLFDTQIKELNETQIRLLGILAKEVIAKIEAIKAQNDLRKAFFEYRASQRSIANDLRNTLTGIIGLSDVLIEQFEELEKEETKDYNQLINNSSKSILSMLDDIIINQKMEETDTNILNLHILKTKLLALYTPLVAIKKIKLNMIINDLKADILFLKNRVNYLVGSLLVEALLNISEKATLTVALDLNVKVHQLYIKVDFASENFINNPDFTESEVLKIYKSNVEELGGELIFNPSMHQLYQLTLPLKSI